MAKGREPILLSAQQISTVIPGKCEGGKSFGAVLAPGIQGQMDDAGSRDSSLALGSHKKKTAN